MGGGMSMTRRGTIREGGNQFVGDVELSEDGEDWRELVPCVSVI